MLQKIEGNHGFDMRLRFGNTLLMRYIATYAYYYYATRITGRVQRRMR